jgi:hypothetical protein
MLKYMRHSAGQAKAAWLRAAPAILVLALAGCTAAGGDRDVTRSAARAVGWAAGDVPEAKDFVRATRPQAEELAWIPVGRAGLERPVRARDAGGVSTLEAALREERERNVSQARRPLPRGAYGQPLPSLALPAQGAPSTAAGQPATFPVNQNRLRQMRENSRRVRPQAQ